MPESMELLKNKTKPIHIGGEGAVKEINWKKSQ